MAAALGTKGHVDDNDRGFDFTIRGGTIGGLSIEATQVRITVGSPGQSLECSADDLIYDEEGKLKIELHASLSSVLQRPYASFGL